VSLRADISTAPGKRRYVRRLFSTIADRYDLITVLLSYGRDRRWKQRLAHLAGVRAGERALDLACGTGDIAFEIADRGARVVGLDITERMIQLARRRSQSRAAFLIGDMMALPFPSASFDLVTTGYGIRNVPDIETALAEIHRVLRPGGRMLSLDFNRPANAVVRGAYLVYLTLVGSTLGFVLHRDPNTYRYIPESIRHYPGADGVRILMRDMGFARAEWIPLLGGLMAINIGRKREDARAA
jgi:demethylmenaquinone methyltransferase/2-methoxy-6-polyprenyl-1,4-benzoquinol methylase